MGPRIRAQKQKDARQSYEDAFRWSRAELGPSDWGGQNESQEKEAPVRKSANARGPSSLRKLAIEAIGGLRARGEEVTFAPIYFLGEIWSSKSAIVCRVFGSRSPSLALRSIVSAIDLIWLELTGWGSVKPFAKLSIRFRKSERFHMEAEFIQRCIVPGVLILS